MKTTIIISLFFLYAISAVAEDQGLSIRIREAGFVASEAKTRSAHIAELLEAIKDANLEMVLRIRAVNVIGDMRAIEAIDVLLENIIKIEPAFIDEKTFQIVCPCGHALIQIGSASRKALIDKLTLSQDAGERSVLVIVLVKIEGYDVAEFLLGNRQKTEPKSKDTLQVVLDLLIKFKDRDKK